MLRNARRRNRAAGHARTRGRRWVVIGAVSIGAEVAAHVPTRGSRDVASKPAHSVHPPTDGAPRPPRPRARRSDRRHAPLNHGVALAVYRCVWSTVDGDARIEQSAL